MSHVSNISSAANAAIAGSMGAPAAPQVSAAQSDVPAAKELSTDELIAMIASVEEKNIEAQRQAGVSSLVDEMKSQANSTAEQQAGIAAQRFSDLLKGALQVVGAGLNGAMGGVGAFGGGSGGADLGFRAGDAVQGMSGGFGSIFAAGKSATAQADQSAAQSMNMTTELFGKWVDSSSQAAQTTLQNEQSALSAIQQSEAGANADVARNL